MQTGLGDVGAIEFLWAELSKGAGDVLRPLLILVEAAANRPGALPRKIFRRASTAEMAQTSRHHA
jgi:hypothetical protein